MILSLSSSTSSFLAISLLKQARLLSNKKSTLKTFSTINALFATTKQRKPQSQFKSNDPQSNYYNFRKRPNSQPSSQQLLKQYFTNRLILSPTQLQSFMVEISKSHSTEKGHMQKLHKNHRWQSLNLTIERYRHQFTLQSKIQIMQSLGRLRQNNSLYNTLYRDIMIRFGELGLEQLAILLWSMVKVGLNDKTVVLAIYKKIYKIVGIRQGRSRVQSERMDQKMMDSKGQEQQENAENTQYGQQGQQHSMQAQPQSIILVSQFATQQQLTNLRQRYGCTDNPVNKSNNIHIDESKQQLLQQQQPQNVILMSQLNFVKLIWSLKKTKTIDQKQIIQLLKHTLSPYMGQRSGHQQKQSSSSLQKSTTTSTNKIESSFLSSFNNLHELRMQSLCLLLHCITQLQFAQYRIVQMIVDRIRTKWQDLQYLNVLALNVLIQSMSRFISYKHSYKDKLQRMLSIEGRDNNHGQNHNQNQKTTSQKNQQKILKTQHKIENLAKSIKKQKRFSLLIVQTIIYRQELFAEKMQKKIANNTNHNEKIQKQSQNKKSPKQIMIYPLSYKFSSQIIFHLGKLNLYEPAIWQKLLYSMTLEIDQATIQDLSMTLLGMCMLDQRQVYGVKGMKIRSDKQKDDKKQNNQSQPQTQSKQCKQDFMFYQYKLIVCKRIFQIFSSIKGKSLEVVESQVMNGRIQEELIPVRIRKQIRQNIRLRKENQYNRQQQYQEQSKTNRNNQERNYQRNDEMQLTKLVHNNDQDTQYDDNTSNKSSTKVKNSKTRKLRKEN